MSKLGGLERTHLVQYQVLGPSVIEGSEIFSDCPEKGRRSKCLESLSDEEGFILEKK